MTATLAKPHLSVYTFWLFFISFLVLNTSYSQADQPLPIATIENVSGEVNLQRSQTSEIKTAQLADTLFKGDKLLTGNNGQASLKLRDGSTLTIIKNRSVTINERLLATEPVGSILFVHGNAEITSSDGLKRRALKGSKVFQGDIIITEAASSVQLRMVDEGYFAVRPESHIKIDDYIFRENDNDKANTTLVRGGLRSITGVIGQTNKENFSLRTPVATIGIRGTDLEAFYLSEEQLKSDALAANPELKPGSYLKVSSGEAELATPQGAQAVKKDQFAFSDSPDTPPVRLPDDQIPAVFNLPTYETHIPGIHGQAQLYPKRITSGYLGLERSIVNDLGLMPSLSSLYRSDHLTSEYLSGAITPPTRIHPLSANDTFTGLGALVQLKELTNPAQTVSLTTGIRQLQGNKFDNLTSAELQFALSQQHNNLQLNFQSTLSLMRFDTDQPDSLQRSADGHDKLTLNLSGRYPLAENHGLIIEGAAETLKFTGTKPSLAEADTPSDRRVYNKQLSLGIWFTPNTHWTLQPQVSAGKQEKEVSFFQDTYIGLGILTAYTSDPLSAKLLLSRYRESSQFLNHANLNVSHKLLKKLTAQMGIQYTSGNATEQDQKNLSLALIAKL